MDITAPPWASDHDKHIEFWTKVTVGGPSQCWPWRGPGTDYGTIYWPSHGTDHVHRVAFQLAHGRPIEGDLVIDHVCDRKKCVNPAHLDEVTREENLRRMGARRTHCARDHARAEHGYTDQRGNRRCRACDADPRRERLTTWTYRRPDLGYAIAGEVDR